MGRKIICESCGTEFKFGIAKDYEKCPVCGSLFDDEENKQNNVIICDSAEPKSIAEMYSYNLRVLGAKKGADSVEYGIKWLQDLEEIVIDPKRCQNWGKCAPAAPKLQKCGNSIYQR